VLLAPGGCHSNLRFFTSGSVIGDEWMLLRAFPVINQSQILFLIRCLRFARLSLSDLVS
jgi:hypothetical protein